MPRARLVTTALRRPASAVLWVAITFTASFLATAVDGSAVPRPPRDPRDSFPRALDYEAAERALAEWIDVRLTRNPQIDPGAVQVRVEDRVVTLRGSVASSKVRRLAERLALRTPGIIDVNNRLTVAVEPRQALPPVEDDVLAERVAHALASEFSGAEADRDWIFGWNVEGADWEIEVDARAGDVRLTGAVDVAGDVDRAIESARAVPGVRAVVCDLSVGQRFHPYPRGEVCPPPAALPAGMDPYTGQF